MDYADLYPSVKAQAATPATGLSIPGVIPSTEEPVPDLTEFRRQVWDLSQMGGLELLSLASLGMGVGPHTRPENLPWEVLDAMGYDPVLYLGEKSVTSVADDADLYFVTHPDDEVKARTWAWLEPILQGLVSAIVPAFSYGVAPFVLDFRQEELAFTVGKGPDTKEFTVPATHVHYGAVHSIWPGDISVRRAPSDELLLLVHGGAAYEAREFDDKRKPVGRRGFLPIWDQQWARLLGQASRRRAYPHWFAAAFVSLWQNRYLERSVDVPRIGYAPEGKITINGKEVPAIRVLTAALMAQKNGSVCVLPSAIKDNTRVWEIDTLDIPDRHQVFHNALTYHDAKKLESCLMPSGVATGKDVLSSAKVADALMRDFVQGIAKFVAKHLTEVVRVVYRFNGGKGQPPKVKANEVPASQRKLLLEILKGSMNAVQRLKDGREYTLAELVDPEIFEKLGVTSRSVDEAAREKQAPPTFGGGKPLDLTSERDERREDARTEEGEDATGKPGEGEDN